MNESPLMTEAHPSNSNISITTIHRHRHRHQNSFAFWLDSIRSKQPPGNSTGITVPGSLHDQSETRHVNRQRDSTFYPGLVNASHRYQADLPNTNPSTASVDYDSTTTYTNRILTFPRTFNNNTASSSSLKSPSHYNHQDLSNSDLENSLDVREYQEKIFIPFNSDEESDSPHFDAEFFPEELPRFNPHQNRTTHSPPIDLYDSYPDAVWDLPSGHGQNIHQPFHTSSITAPFGVNPQFTANITNFIFGHNEISREIDFLVPRINFSSVLENDFNSSSNHGVHTSAGDLYTWSILMMAPLVIFGIAGNTLVILAISLERRLQNVTNYFLLSLAVTDLLVSLIVMPFSIINVFTGRWLFGLLLCDFFVTSDVLMCTSSILHLCTISLERYIGIRYPLWTKNKSKRIVLLKIVFVWTIALAITSPITVLGVMKEENVLVQGACVLSNVHFIIYGSTFAFFIPLGIMVLMYVLTVRMLNKQARLCHSRRIKNGEGQPIIRRSTSRRKWQGRRKYYTPETLCTTSADGGTRMVDDDVTGLISPFHQRYRSTGVTRHNTIPLCHCRPGDYLRRDTCAGDNGHVGGSGNGIHRGCINSNIVCTTTSSGNTDGGKSAAYNYSNVRRNRFASQNGTSNTSYVGLKPPTDFPYCNGFRDAGSKDFQSDSQKTCSSRLSSSSSSSSPTSSTNREPNRLHDMVRKHHVAVKAANMLLTKRESQGQGQGQSSTQVSSTHASVRRDNSVRTEQKASKVLGVVFMIFVICWAPFFTVNILTAVCTSCKFEPTLVTAFVWLGYVSSTLNPIIYTIFNNIFRITFIKLLCCRYRLLHRARRSSSMPGIRNGVLNYSDFSQAPHGTTPHNTTNTTNTTITTNSTFVEESNC